MTDTKSIDNTDLMALLKKTRTVEIKTDLVQNLS